MRVYPRPTAAEPPTGLKRRWRLPPPIMQDGEGPGPEGMAILEEFPSELGAVLWKSLRSVLLWAEQDAQSRRKLFEDGAADRRQLEILQTVDEDEVELREALEDLLPVLDKPERADREFVALACSRLATWAEGRNAPRAALECLQAAAVCTPADPVLALAAGRAARDLARYGRAEAWLQRAIGLARQAKRWRTYVDAYRAHGKMMAARGALPAARRSYLKALRRSRRQGYRDGEAVSLHHLFVLEHRCGNFADALTYAEAAVEAHRPDHVDLPRLAHDIAYHWLDLGNPERALPVLLEMLNKAPIEARPAGLGSVGRAAAACGDPQVFEWARTELQELESRPGVAEAWIDIARGALELDRHSEAEEAAGIAESVARSRREGQMRFLAEEIMTRIQEERERVVEPDEVPVGTGDAVNARVARELIRSLQLAPDLEHTGAAG